jgi:hypothetical protein
MPRLTSKLAVVPAKPEKEAQTLEEKFREVFDQGTEATERLEITKSRLEKELRRRSESVRTAGSFRMEGKACCANLVSLLGLSAAVS